VLSTLHTNDASAAITRLLDIGVPHYLIQGTLIGVMAQRLVRTLCPHCKAAAPLEDTLWEPLVHPWPIRKPDMIATPSGCNECRNTGFLGRTGLYELLTVTPSLRRLFQSTPDTARLRNQAIKDGMRPLRISAAYHIAAGLTTLEEVMKVLPPLEEED